MFKLFLLVCWSVSFSSSSITINGQFWWKTYVSQSELDIGFVKKITYALDDVWGLKCVLGVTDDPLINLVCYVNGECIFYVLLREGKQTPDAGVTDPVKCITRFKAGDQPCDAKKRDSLMHKPFGCLKIFTNKMDLNSSLDRCTSLGMNFPSMEYFDTRDQFWEFDANWGLTYGGYYFISLEQDGPGGRWFWHTGTELAVNSVLWTAGQPGTRPREEFSLYAPTEGIHDAFWHERYWSFCSFP